MIRQATAQNLNRSTKRLQKGVPNTTECVNDSIFDFDFYVNPGFTSERLLAKKHYVSSTVDDYCQECTLETYTYRIIHVHEHEELEVDNKLHKDDDSHTQNAQELRDYASRCGPGCWIFVGPVSNYTRKHDRKPNGYREQEALRIPLRYIESGHPVILGTTLFKHGTLRHKEKRSTPARRQSDRVGTYYLHLLRDQEGFA